MSELINKYFPVLDHGFVALKNYMGSDEAIEETARNSYKKGTRKTSDTRGLIRYLIKHHHNTPVETGVLQFHMQLPLFVRSQLVRHRTAQINEYSLRYSEPMELFYTPPEYPLQSTTNKQGREEEKISGVVEEYFHESDEKLRKSALKLYREKVEGGVAREIARLELPVSLYTQWYFKIDLHNLFHLLSLRLDPHAQYETRQYAKVMAGITAALFPLSFEAFLDYRLNNVEISGAEQIVLNKILLNLDKEHIILKDIVDNHLEYHMSKREAGEFVHKWQKLHTDHHNLTYKMSDFQLDLTQAKESEYFEKLTQES